MNFYLSARATTVARLVLLLVASAGWACHTPQLTPNQNVLRFHEQTEDASRRRGDWHEEQLQSLNDNGMEPDSAGFHFCRANDDETGHPMAAWPSESYRYNFRSVQVAFLEPVAAVRVVSDERALHNDSWGGARVLSDPAEPDRYTVELKVTERLLSWLDAFVEPSSATEQYEDWYGAGRAPEEAPTEFRATLVMQDRAFKVISFTEGLAEWVPGEWIEVAARLTSDEAAKLAQIFGT